MAPLIEELHLVVSQNWGYFEGVPRMRTMVYWGLYWVFPLFWETTICAWGAWMCEGLQLWPELDTMECQELAFVSAGSVLGVLQGAWFLLL